MRFLAAPYQRGEAEGKKKKEKGGVQTRVRTGGVESSSISRGRERSVGEVCSPQGKRGKKLSRRILACKAKRQKRDSICYYMERKNIVRTSDRHPQFAKRRVYKKKGYVTCSMKETQIEREQAEICLNQEATISMRLI